MADQIPKNSKADQNAAWAAEQMKRPQLFVRIDPSVVDRWRELRMQIRADAARAYSLGLQEAVDEGRIGHLRADILQGAPIQHFLTPDQLEAAREAGRLGWFVATIEGVDDDDNADE